jgi:hypothetical protein
LDGVLLAVLAIGPVLQALDAFRRLLWLPFGMDSYKWIEATDALGRGDWARFSDLDRPPLFPALVVLLDSLGIPPAHGGTEISLVCWGLLPAAGWLALRPLAGREAALCGAAALYFSPMALVPACQCGSQALFNLVLAVVAIAALEAARRPPMAWAVLGLTAGLAAAAKEQGLLLLGPIALWALIAPVRGAVRSRAWEVSRRLGAFLAGAALPVAASLWLCWLLHPGGLMATKLGEYLVDARALLTAADWRQVAIHPVHWERGKQAARHLDPGLVGLARHALRISARWLVSLGPTVGLAPIAAGVLWCARIPALRHGARLALLLLLPFLLLLALPLAQPFHISFAVIPLVLLAGLGLGALLTMARTATRPGVRWGLRLAAFTWTAFMILPEATWGGRFERQIAVSLGGAWGPTLGHLGGGALAGPIGVQGAVGRQLAREALPARPVVVLDGRARLAALAADPSARLILHSDLRLTAGWEGFRLVAGQPPAAAAGWQVETWAQDDASGVIVAVFTPARAAVGPRP